MVVRYGMSEKLGLATFEAPGRAPFPKTLTAKRAVLEALAKLLIEQEVVDRATLPRILSAAAPA